MPETKNASTALIDSLNWRYATKKFDSEKKLDDETLAKILEALRLSASSFGLQPWKFVVVSDPEIKKQLPAVSWGQMQPQDCSHLVVICRIAELDEAFVDKFLNTSATTRGVTVDSLASYSAMIKGFLSNAKDKETWAAKQCYIALGTLLTAAAHLGVDACPMEGFDAAAYDKILGLEKLGCHSVVICPLGYRASDDKYAQAPKVRFESEDVIVRI